MFKEIVRSTEFTSPQAESLFGSRIWGSSWNNDVSFVSSLRAMVYPRMKEGNVLWCSFTRASYSDRDLKGMSAGGLFAAALGQDRPEAVNDGVIICNVGGSTENNALFFDMVSDKFCKEFPKFSELQKVTAFYRKSFKVACFINPENKTTVLFVEHLSPEKLHYLQCSIFAILPWYFDPKVGASPEEMELIYSFRERNPAKFYDALHKLSLVYDFREQFIRNSLKGFETQFEEEHKRNVENDIRNLYRNIDSYDRQISEWLKSIYEKETQLIGINHRISDPEESESELMDYFLTNKRLTLEEVCGSRITFAVSTYLENFDEDAAETDIKNKRSYLYDISRSSRTDIPADDMQALLKAIFIDKTLRMRMCASYSLALPRSVQANGRHRYGPEFSTCMQNPHIETYSCLGNYGRELSELMSKGNYVSAVECCIASAGSLNFHDPTVMNTFLGVLYGTETGSYHSRCIETPDGQILTPKEAMLYLREHK